VGLLLGVNLYLPVPIEEELQNARGVRGAAAHNDTGNKFEWGLGDETAFTLASINLESDSLMLAAKPIATFDFVDNQARAITVHTDFGATGQSLEALTSRQAVAGKPDIVFFKDGKYVPLKLGSQPG